MHAEQQTLTGETRRVKRRWKIFLLGASGLIVVVSVCFFCLREKEPSYNGRTLSDWLDAYDPAMPGAVVPPANIQRQQQRVPAEAIAKIGTNALPFVLKWANGVDPRQRPWLYKSADELPTALRVPLQKMVWKGSAARRWQHAALTVKILHTNAEPILPELTARFRSSTTPYETWALADMIAALGPKGFEYLAGAMTDNTGNQRIAAIDAMRQKTRAEVAGTSVVPALLSVINDPSNAQPDPRWVRVAATNALKTIAPEVLTNSPSN